MDTKSAKRVDGIYRNIKQLPTLGCLGLFIPIVGIFLVPIAFAYDRLRIGLLRDFSDGKMQVEEHDRVASKPGTPTTEEKLRYLRDGDTRMWIPYLVGTIWVLLIGTLVAAIVLNN